MKNSVLKTSVVVLATIAAGFCATPAAAETIHAKVLSSSPIYKSVVTYVPQQVCMDEVVSHNTQNQYNNNGGIINSGVNGIFGSTQGMIGATIGGVIGNEPNFLLFLTFLFFLLYWKSLLFTDSPLGRLLNSP